MHLYAFIAILDPKLVAMGRCHGNQILAKIGKKITKMAITSVLSDKSMQRFVLRSGLCHQDFICDIPVHKGQRVVTMATNFGTKIAINAYKCISTRDNENAITDNRWFS